MTNKAVDFFFWFFETCQTHFLASWVFLWRRCVSPITSSYEMVRQFAKLYGEERMLTFLLFTFKKEMRSFFYQWKVRYYQCNGFLTRILPKRQNNLSSQFQKYVNNEPGSKYGILFYLRIRKCCFGLHTIWDYTAWFVILEHTTY